MTMRGLFGRGRQKVGLDGGPRVWHTEPGAEASTDGR